MGVKSGAQLKCIYTNAHSVGNKQDELEAIVQQDSCDVVAITEVWWDDGHNWNAVMDGYKLFRRDRQGRRGGGVALYVRECFDCIELDSSDDKVERLWVRMKGKANKGVCSLIWEGSAIDHPTRMRRQMSQPNYPQGVQPPELEDKVGEQNKSPPVIQEEVVNDLLLHLNPHKSMGLNWIHASVLRELVGELTKPLSIIYQQSWSTGEVPDDWRVANVMPIYKKG
ncbi:rna-directed dna polymerase from mobile element hypothetical protein [Limosa lapponica baueri]|uniref:Endonuclease/exonuclease/phosphatase domain-containing protein n=1 Tax=Limosa lapponica baueri TaxID=1758121 RepID=A0A2I0TCG4_LIMLA|nr:rna-directed dna polymerase from mobile element hypothetical protein [Limosa lapponica baueri]